MVAATVVVGLVWRFQKARSRTAELFAHQARHDSLTALPNRVLLAERLDAELARAARRGEPVFLLWLDLDDFKDVNDSFGLHGRSYLPGDLTGPDGVRVEQIRVDRLDGAGVRTLLRLTHHGRWTADCRTVEELARYVDLARLVEETDAGGGGR